MRALPVVMSLLLVSLAGCVGPGAGGGAGELRIDDAAVEGNLAGVGISGATVHADGSCNLRGWNVTLLSESSAGAVETDIALADFWFAGDTTGYFDSTGGRTMDLTSSEGAIDDRGLVPQLRVTGHVDGAYGEHQGDIDARSAMLTVTPLGGRNLRVEIAAEFSDTETLNGSFSMNMPTAD